MSKIFKRAALVAAMATLAPLLAQQAFAQARCSGLFCDMYYASAAPSQPGAPVPAPGEPGSTFLPCHDFVCGMFGGRTPDRPVAAVSEPAPVAAPADDAAKPKRKRSAKRVAKAEVKPKPAEPAAQ